MKKIINNIDDIVSEMVHGIVSSYPQKLKILPGTLAIARNDAAFSDDKKVGVVSGGGSGHEPLHSGYVGKGMLCAAVCGQINTSPTPDQIYEAIKYADKGQGVLLIVKNYAGDDMNFDMAKELAEFDDIKVESILVDDDISAADDAEDTQGKRGVAGTVLVEKICGAAAEQGMELHELAQLGQRVINNTKTVAVALSAATVPAVGHPGFELDDDQMEYGVGIHNERGFSTEKIAPSKQIAEELINKILKSYDHNTGDYAVLVNGLGSTPLMEQFVFANDVLNLLKEKGIKVSFTKVGNKVTAIDMHGISLTLMKLENNWIEYLEAPTDAISW
ncbi:dihydroxyacetone kinase subunit DhaK [Sporolactobacillus kofuensis]|uniref:Dihydroxyacetone kinase subunit DhaK n=1 Tax=Sporolactobacillus kofuensis TaxID=269672 RepID=A0ABW1WF80_9BACL|nr:dihydroxyacetone kinase subunit DhaK [Sporolactobacillus kofuensis]MCO7175467.1 dihydroxyacetone kinase subunit DhaK [Sporolactobacillus kofuensis]